MTEEEWGQEVARQIATSDGPAYRDGLSSGIWGGKRKPPRDHQSRAGSWYDGYDMGVKWLVIDGSRKYAEVIAKHSRNTVLDPLWNWSA